MAIRLGLGLPQLRQYDLAKDVTDVARAAERTGYDSVWVYERLLVPESPTQGLYGVPGLPWPDWYRGMAHPLVTLTLAAAVTERVRLGTGVVVAPLHGPVQLAKALATLDAASGGRVVAGLGTGWSTDEFAAAGIGPHNRRGGLLEEVIKVCRAVWGPDPVSFEGRTTKIDAAVVGPKPARPIPVLVAAGGDRALGRVVDLGDGWIPVAMDVQGYAAGWRKLQDIAAERGRTRPIERVPRVNALYSATPYDGDDRQPFQGSADQIVADLAAYAEVGVDEVLLDLQTNPRDAQELKDAAADPSAVILHAGTDRTWPGLAHHTLSFGAAWESTFDELTRTGALMSDPSLLITRPTTHDPELAPPGRHLHYVLAPCPNTDVGPSAPEWRDLGPRYRDSLVAELERRGLTGFGASVQEEMLVTPLDWTAQGHAAGSPFSVSHTFAQTGPFRPRNLVRGVDNAVLAGCGTTPGVGVPTVLVSGKLAAARVTGGTAPRRLSRAHALPPTGRAASAPTVRGTDVPS